MTKHNFCPMIMGRKSQNKATRIFVFASIYYSTYYYFTTILCSLWKSLFTSYSTSSSGWRSADQQGWSVRTSNVEEISSTNLSHLTHFIQYFPGFLLLKWWVQCLACIIVIYWAFFFATLKIFAHFWDLILKINCMLQTHLKLDRSQSRTVLKLFLFKLLTCSDAGYRNGSCCWIWNDVS